MNENHMKNFELDKLSDELYADAPGLDPELEWEEETVTESPIEEASVERIGDFMVRNGNEVVEYVGTSTIVVIPEEFTSIAAFLVDGKPVDEVHIPSTVTEISGAAFFEATSLGKIIVDEANPVYSSIDGCLYSKDKKRFLYCSDKIEPLYIAEGCEVIESCAFFKRDVREVYFPRTLKKLDPAALANCNIDADELTLPYGVELDYEVFQESVLPRRVNLPGITKLPALAFSCAKFTSMCLPDTLVEIEGDAFASCKMSRVYISRSVKKIEEGAFNYYYSDGTEGYFEDDLEPDVYPCPDGFVLGVDNEECYAAQYAKENNIPYEVVTDVEAFLNMSSSRNSAADEWMLKAYVCVEKSEEAAECFAKAAELGDVLAKFYLAQCYEKDEGVPQDYVKAAELYMEVSRCREYLVSYDHHPQGCAEYALGSFYERGLLPDSTMEKAVEWYKRALWSGNRDAYFNLAECYLNGQGVGMNCNSAAKMLCEYCWRYGENDERVFAIAKRLENEETEYQADVFRVLYLCYANGVGTNEDREKALEYSGMYAAWKEAEELEGLKNNTEHVTPGCVSLDDDIPW